QPDENTLLFSLNRLRETHPSPNRTAALNQLKGLSIVDGEVIAKAMHHVWLAERAVEEETDKLLAPTRNGEAPLLAAQRRRSAAVSRKRTIEKNGDFKRNPANVPT